MKEMNIFSSTKVYYLRYKLAMVAELEVVHMARKNGLKKLKALNTILDRIERIINVCATRLK